MVTIKSTSLLRACLYTPVSGLYGALWYESSLLKKKRHPDKTQLDVNQEMRQHIYAKNPHVKISLSKCKFIMISFFFSQKWKRALFFLILPVVILSEVAQQRCVRKQEEHCLSYGSIVTKTKMTFHHSQKFISQRCYPITTLYHFHLEYYFLFSGFLQCMLPGDKIATSHTPSHFSIKTCFSGNATPAESTHRHTTELVARISLTF